MSDFQKIDIDVESKYVEELCDVYFKHTLEKGGIANLFKQICTFVDENYGHVYIYGTYKSGLGNLIRERIEAIREIHINRNNRGQIFEDKEFNLFRNLGLKSREMSENNTHEDVMRNLKKEFGEEFNIFKKFKINKDQEEVDYKGFNSGGGTHPGIDVLLEKSYIEYRLERHSGKLYNHIAENLLTHALEMQVMNNDIAFREEMRAYVNSIERDETTGLIIKDDESLLRKPYLQYILEINDETYNEEQEKKLKEDYLQKKGMFKDKIVVNKEVERKNIKP